MQGNNAAVSDIELLNSYNGISAVGAARHYLARIQGQPTNMGIFIDQTYDIGRIEDVHFNPWFENSAPYYDWQYLHGIAFSIARSDWEYVFNTFAFGYAIGYQFIESTTGSCNGNFVGIGADGILNNSVVVESADPWGIDIVNGEFTAFQVYKDLPFNAPAQIVSLPSNGGVVSFTSCAFWGPAQNIARLDGKPAGGTRFDFLKILSSPDRIFHLPHPFYAARVSFDNCIFNQWAYLTPGAPAFQVTGSVRVSIQNCDFQQTGMQLHTTASTKSLIVKNNMINGALNISLGSRGPGIIVDDWSSSTFTRECGIPDECSL